MTSLKALKITKHSMEMLVDKTELNLRELSSSIGDYIVMDENDDIIDLVSPARFARQFLFMSGEKETTFVTVVRAKKE